MGPREKALRESRGGSDVQKNAIDAARREDVKEVWRRAQRIAGNSGTPQANELK